MNEDFWKIQAEARAALCNDWEKLYKAMQQIKDEEIAELKKQIEELKGEEEIEECEYCGGDGYVVTMQATYPGEAPMSPTGSTTCICKE